MEYQIQGTQVYKGLMGNWVEGKGDHRIVSERIYQQMIRDIDKAQFEARELRESLSSAKNKAQSEKNHADWQHKEEVEKLQATIQKLERRYAEQVKLNENLIRINRERSNAARNLVPKKEHTGYVIQQSDQKHIRYHESREAVVWETTFQTPYSIDIPSDELRSQIARELYYGVDGGASLQDMGIEVWKMAKNKELKDLIDPYQPELQGKNILYRMRFKANFRTGLWEVVLSHLKELRNVPAEFRPVVKACE